MPETITYKAIVRYVGTNFSGWQVQPYERTVQGEIAGAIAKISRDLITIHGASRTDAGVHALGQVCSFAMPKGTDSERLRHSLSQMLGPEIRIVSIEAALPGFHARKLARGKRYCYALDLGREPDPFSSPFSWHAPLDLDPGRLDALCGKIEGAHDFAGFEAGRAAPKHSTVRTLHSLRLEKGGVIQAPDAKDIWRLTFHGDGFLYKMVRNITGTLIDVVRGHLPESRIDELFASAGPYHGFTVPAKGLTLMEVLY
jgi:tRNA pseudouridine38-40 synthase